MNRQSITVVLVAALLVAVGLLWLRVRQLEGTVHALNQRLASIPSLVSLPRPESGKNTGTSGVFRLISTPAAIDRNKSDAGNQLKSNVGVPWAVEHAMMGEENPIPQRNNVHIDKKSGDTPMLPTTLDSK